MSYTFTYETYWKQWLFGYVYGKYAREHFICLGPLMLIIAKDYSE